MSQPELMVFLTPPSQQPVDITARIASLRSISESVEDDLTQLVHGDMDLDLDNSDGWVSDTLENAVSGDVYELAIYRETQRRRPKWETVFGGVLDIDSMRYDRKDRTAQAQVFSYSRLLELATAEDLKRTITDRAGSVTGGTKIVSMSDTTDILIGDTIELGDSAKTEEFVVASVDGSTQVTAVDNLTNSFTAADATVLTPYYRNKTVEWLADQLLTQAGIDTGEISITQELAEYPVETQINTDGLPSADPLSIVQQDGQIVASYSASDRMAADSPQSGFSSLVVDHDPQADWRPYLLEQPATIREGGDIGNSAFDHTNAHTYDLLDTINSPGNTTLEIRQDGTPLATIDSWADPLEGGYDFFWLDYESQNDDAWIAFKRSDDTDLHFGYYEIGGSWHELNVTAGGPMRSIRALSVIAVQQSGSTTMRLYDITSKTAVQTVTVPQNITMWTMRYFDGFVAVLYRLHTTMRIKVWDATTWAEVADYAVSTGLATDAKLTVFDDASGKQVGVGFSNGVYFVLAKYFAGVVPYADFEGMSCADAMRDLALVSMSILQVTPHKLGILRGRSYIDEASAETDIGVPLSQESRQSWELYRTSVTVGGQTEAGDDIEEMAGDTGDTEHRLEVSSNLITTTSLAAAIANLYLAFFSQQRSQEDVDVEEAGTILRTFDLATLDGQRYLVLGADTELEDRTQTLTLVQA